MAEAAVSARKDLARRAEREIRECQRLGVRLVRCTDAEYPASFESLPDGPLLLWMRGGLPEAVVRVAIVGSRRGTAYGRRVATGLASGLVVRGVEVVSGGARGVDTWGHVGALEAGGRTVAVLGSGLGVPYPPENVGLFERIAASGAVLSEFSLETGPRPDHFPRRNRLISALSAAVVVVEASPRSGSLGTASHALDQGREVLAVPGPVSSEQSQGCHRLIQQGAKLVQNVEDVLEELSPMYAVALTGRAGRPRDPAAIRLEGMSEDEIAVLALLSDPEPLHLDALAEAAPFGVARLQAALFGLELRRAVEELPGGYYLAQPGSADADRSG